MCNLGRIEQRFSYYAEYHSDFWITGITEQEAKGEEKKFTPAIDDQKHFTLNSATL